MKFPTVLSTSATILSVALSASAHGYVQSITIGSKVYPAWHPFDDPYVSPTPSLISRKVPDDGPVTDITSTSLACNTGGLTGAALTADVNAGSTVGITWNRWPSDHLGPITLWMANCGGSCTNFDPSKGAVWFKISQATLSGGTWPTEKLIADDLTWPAVIPSDLKSGNYLLRMEILALHSAGAPQFYPSCSQLNVKGSGTKVPSSSELVAIPGVYANAGSAIFGDIWNQPTTWPVAGPKVASLVAGAADGGGDAPASTIVKGSTTAKAATATATVVKASSSASASSASGKPATTAPAGVVKTPTPMVSSTASAALPSSTGKTCKNKKRKVSKAVKAPVIEARTTNEYAIKAARAEERAVKPEARSWASHSKAKRARNVLRN